MWSAVSAVAHWLNSNVGSSGDPAVMTLIDVDDAERVAENVRVAGCMILTGLDAIDRAGELKPDSRFHDLGLVMSLCLKWSWGLEEYGIGEEGECEWCPTIVAYAKKASLDLAKAGAGDNRRALDKYRDVKTLKSTAKVGRWKWPSTVSQSVHIPC